MSKLKQPTGVTEPNRRHTPEARAKISAAMKRRRARERAAKEAAMAAGDQP